MKRYILELYYKYFYYKSDEKLSRKSLLLIIILNILIISLIIKGVDNQINKLKTPNEIFPKTCIDLVNEKKLKNIDSKIYNKNILFSNFEKVDIRCTSLIEKFEKLVIESDIYNLKNEYKKLNEQKGILTQSIQEIEKKFSNISTSDIYKINAGKYVIVENKNLNEIRKIYSEDSYKLDTLIRRITVLEKSYINLNSLVTLTKELDVYRADIKKDYKDSFIVYRFKKIFITLIFLLPLYFIFLHFLNKYRRKRKYIYFYIFRSLLLTIIIPILLSLFLYVIYFLLTLFPYNLVIEIINDKPSNSIIDYYFIITLTILLFILLSSRIQKKHTKAVKNYKKVSSRNYYGDIYKTKR